MTFRVRVLTQICIFLPCVSDSSPWSAKLCERDVIYFYRRTNWLTVKHFVRNRMWKGNILSRNCSKYDFLSLCPNNDMERSVFVWRRWYSGEYSCLPSSWRGFDSRPTHLYFFIIFLFLDYVNFLIMIWRQILYLPLLCYETVQKRKKGVKKETFMFWYRKSISRYRSSTKPYNTEPGKMTHAQDYIRQYKAPD